jgi:hypothetical protein
MNSCCWSVPWNQHRCQELVSCDLQYADIVLNLKVSTCSLLLVIYHITMCCKLPVVISRVSTADQQKKCPDIIWPQLCGSVLKLIVIWLLCSHKDKIDGQRKSALYVTVKNSNGCTACCTKIANRSCTLDVPDNVCCFVWPQITAAQRLTFVAESAMRPVRPWPCLALCRPLQILKPKTDDLSHRMIDKPISKRSSVKHDVPG